MQAATGTGNAFWLRDQRMLRCTPLVTIIDAAKWVFSDQVVMRKSPFNFRSMWLGVRLAGSFWLAIFLLAPVPGRASSKRFKMHRFHTHMAHSHPQPKHAHRTAQLHRSSSHPHRVQPSANRKMARRHSRTHGSSPYIHGVAYRRRGPRARAQRYRMQAALEEISTHTTPAETASSAETAAPIGDSPEVPSQACSDQFRQRAAHRTGAARFRSRPQAIPAHPQPRPARVCVTFRHSIFPCLVICPSRCAVRMKCWFTRTSSRMWKG